MRHLELCCCCCCCCCCCWNCFCFCWCFCRICCFCCCWCISICCNSNCCWCNCFWSCCRCCCFCWGVNSDSRLCDFVYWESEDFCWCPEPFCCWYPCGGGTWRVLVWTWAWTEIGEGDFEWSLWDVSLIDGTCRVWKECCICVWRVNGEYDWGVWSWGVLCGDEGDWGEGMIGEWVGGEGKEAWRCSWGWCTCFCGWTLPPSWDFSWLCRSLLCILPPSSWSVQQWKSHSGCSPVGEALVGATGVGCPLMQHSGVCTWIAECPDSTDEPWRDNRPMYVVGLCSPSWLMTVPWNNISISFSRIVYLLRY